MRWAALLLVSSTAAAAPAFVPQRAVVVGRVDDGAWTDAATEARSDQRAELAAIVIGTRGGKRVVLAPDGVTRVNLEGRVVTPEQLGAATLSWFAVEPHGFRDAKAKNGATSDFYSNVSTETKNFGHWLGYDHIDYFERALAPTTPTITAVIDSPEAQLAGLGTLRFKVDVEVAGTHVASAGAEATDTFGITAAVHRVSIRNGDDFLGWMTSYLLVPEVFGSAGPGKNHQTERFTGADCADIMVGAIRRSGRTDLAYTNVAGLPGYSTPVAGSVAVDKTGTPEHPITGVARGDLIRIDYGGELAHHTNRDWDHVVALWEDKSDPNGPDHGRADGKLDGFDLVIHMGHPRLVIEPLAKQAPATVDVWRWKRKT